MDDDIPVLKNLHVLKEVPYQTAYNKGVTNFFSYFPSKSEILDWTSIALFSGKFGIFDKYMMTCH